ncbi:MAG TPA: hypothetical protein VD846_11590 [Allosphingosinicella sp.]|nr:hypothetical protein [Allosphingosinicella sp.]
MRPDPVLLDSSAPGRRRAAWRPLTGRDEIELAGCDYLTAVGWLGKMLAGESSDLRPDDLGQLSIADADRLFGAIYRHLFGDRAEMRQTCSGCGEPFELTIALAELENGTAGEAGATLDLPGGTRLRQVTVDDLARAAGADPGALADAATVELGSDDRAAIGEAFDRLGSPAIDTLETDCPHCGSGQRIAFDLSRFLLACVARERPLLLREVHLLALSYGWSFAEIMALERSTRHELVRLAGASDAAARRAA